MKAFTLHNPKSLDAALALLPEKDTLEARSRTKVLAGGQDLITELKERLETPTDVVSLAGVPGLREIRETAEGLELGALVTLAEVEESAAVAASWPSLAEAAGSVGSPQIRASATVGGNLCQRPRCPYYRNKATRCLKKGGNECFAYLGFSRYNAIFGGGPSYIVHPSDMAPALVALDAEVVLASPRGERTLPLSKFYVLPGDADDVTRENVLAADEVVKLVRVPKPRGEVRATYLKFRERDSYDFALASVALTLWMDGDKVRDARIVLGGVAPIPWRAAGAEGRMKGAAMDMDAWKACAAEAVKGADPLEHNEFKIPLTQGLIVRAMERLA